LACTSNACASSASVLSPFKAVIDTFALKIGVWFRLVRFVIISPVRPRIPMANIRQKRHSSYCVDFWGLLSVRARRQSSLWASRMPAFMSARF